MPGWVWPGRRTLGGADSDILSPASPNWRQGEINLVACQRKPQMSHPWQRLRQNLSALVLVRPALPVG
jgi:hypothetical protein